MTSPKNPSEQPAPAEGWKHPMTLRECMEAEEPAQPAPAEAPEPWTDAKLRGIASDYFREAKDWPAAMLCMRHLLMEQRAAAPAEAGSAPLVLPEDDPVRAGFERWAFSVGWRNFTRDEHSGAYVVEGGLEHRWIGWRACHAYPLHATPMSPKQESR